MSYTKQTWINGDTITAEKLNHIEDGISGSGGGALLVKYTATYDNDLGDYVYTPDKSTLEIAQAYNSGTPVFATVVQDGYQSLEYVLDYAYDDEAYFIGLDITTNEYDNRSRVLNCNIIDHTEFEGQGVNVSHKYVSSQLWNDSTYIPVVLSIDPQNSDHLIGGYGDIGPGEPAAKFKRGKEVYFIKDNSKRYVLVEVGTNNKYYFANIDKNGTIDVIEYQTNGSYLEKVTQN